MWLNKVLTSALEMGSILTHYQEDEGLMFHKLYQVAHSTISLIQCLRVKLLRLLESLIALYEEKFNATFVSSIFIVRWSPWTYFTGDPEWYLSEQSSIPRRKQSENEKRLVSTRSFKKITA